MNGLFRLQTDDRPDCASPGESEQAPSDLCIGILNHLFFWPELYRRTGGMSIVFLFDENPDVASAGSGGAAVGGARSVPDHAVGSRWQPVSALRLSGINRIAARRGAGGQAQMAEDFDYHRRIFDGALRRGSGQAMIFKVPPQFGQCSMSMSKTRLSSLAQLRRAGAPCACA